jgi:alpha-tubulin suppressor-like RCC1 family protein
MKLRHLTILIGLAACGARTDNLEDTTPEGPTKEAAQALATHQTFTISAGNAYSQERIINSGGYAVAGAGLQTDGRLGNGLTSGNATTPVLTEVIPAAGACTGNCAIKQVVSGYGHTVVLLQNGDVWGYGMDNYGQLCDGSTADVITPKLIFNHIDRIGAATYGTFLISDSLNATWACGRNDHGQLGQGDTVSPVTIARFVYSTAPKFAEIVGSDDHTMFVGANGADVLCAGAGDRGQCAVVGSDIHVPGLIVSFCNTDGNGPSPVHVAAGLKFSLISGTVNGVSGLCGQSSVWGFGDNMVGQLGLGHIDSTIHGLTFLFGTANGSGKRMLSVSAGPSSSFLSYQNSDGQDHVIDTGANGQGQLGTGDTTMRNAWTDEGGFGPSQNPGGFSIGTHVVAGQTDSYVWRVGGSVNVPYCAGANANGECGVGTTSRLTVFTQSQL